MPTAAPPTRSWSPTTVVLIRAWREGRGVRGRVIFEEGENRVESVVGGSVEEICAIARRALDSWLDAR